MMKNLLAVIRLTLIALALFGCSADYDTFGESDYRTLTDISFKEQDGSASVYADEHKIEVTVVSPTEDSLEYVTLDEVSMSSLATLHLVDGQFDVFPEDSVELESLARRVSFQSKELKKGSKIRIPKEKPVYLMVVSESGKPAIWQVKFVMVVQESSSNSESENVSSSSEAGDESGSSSKAQESSSSTIQNSSSSMVLSSEKKLDVFFRDAIKAPKSGDSIKVLLPMGSVVDSVILDSIRLSEGAKADPDPLSVKSWVDPKTIKVTAEDGSSKDWIIVVSVATDSVVQVSDEKELVSISAAGETSEAKVDKENRVVTLYLPSKAAARNVSVNADVSPLAELSRSLESVSLLDTLSFDIIAENSSSESWKLIADYPLAPAPRLLSLKIDGHDAIIDSVAEGDGYFYWVHYDNLEFLADLTALTVSDIKLSEKATLSGIEEGSSYDLGKGMVVTVINDDEDRLSYEIRAGYQYSSMGITSSDWAKDDNGNLYDLKGWDNGNNSFTKELAVSVESGEVLQMKTTKYMGKIASGNTFTAYFNPKNVNAISMLSYEDGNELIDFGRPFYGRPRYVEFDAKYAGSGDSCDMYLLLESRQTASGEIRTANDGKNQYRSSTDVNTLLASAWFRAKTVDDDSDPDVVFIKEATRSGFKTIRMKLKYGVPLEGSPLYQSSVLTTKLKNSSGIANYLLKTESPDDFPVTHLRVVMAASANGNVYKGVEGATLLVDAVRLIY